MIKNFLTSTNPLSGKTTYYKTVFYSVMFLSIVVLFASLLITQGKSANYFLFLSDYERNDDTFMDFFNSVVNTYQNPYDAKVIYPAICSLFFRFVLMIISPEAFNSVITDPSSCSQPKELKLYQSFMITAIIFFVIVIVLFCFAVCGILKKRANSEKAVISLLALLSAPFLFLIERGNILFLSLVFTMLFVAYYDSENRAAREFSLLCLALAISIKIYPAVFAVLLFNEKRYRELFRAVLYTLIFFFLPFAFFGGIGGVVKFIQNLTSTSSNISSEVSRQLSFQKFPVYIKRMFGSTSYIWNISGKILLVICAAFGAFSLFISKERWKTASICACLIVGVPGMSSRYSLTFFIIPVLLLILDESENKKFSYASLVIISLIFAVKPIFIPWAGSNTFFGYKLDSILYFVLFWMLCINAILQFIKRIRAVKVNEAVN